MSEPVSGPSDIAVTAPRRAVVVGAGLAGLLAAAALRDHAEVTVVERDALPEGPGPRKSLPQARHAHLLWSGGARAMEDAAAGGHGRLAGGRCPAHPAADRSGLPVGAGLGAALARDGVP